MYAAAVAALPSSLFNNCASLYFTIAIPFLDTPTQHQNKTQLAKCKLICCCWFFCIYTFLTILLFHRFDSVSLSIFVYVAVFAFNLKESRLASRI